MMKAFVGAALGVLGLVGGNSVAHAQDLQIWALTLADDTSSAAWNKVFADFQAANPGVTITYTGRGTDEHKSALRVAANSDQAPDIFFSWGGLGLGGEFVKSGLAADMTKYYDQYKWKDRLLPAASTFATQYPGGTFGVPSSFRGEALYYSKSLFAKAGITTPPTTWAELDADADKLVASGVAPITFGGTVNWHVMRLLDAALETKCGAEKHDALTSTKVKWTDQPCATDAFKEFHTWTSKYFLKPFMGIDDSQAFSLFTGGKAAMMLEGDWLVNRLKDAGKLDDTGVFPIPTGTGRLYGFGDYYYISSKSKNPDLAAKFLDYLTSTDVQKANPGLWGAISVNKEVTSTATEPLSLAWNDIFANAKGLYVNGDQAFPLDVTTEYWRIQNEVASDNLDPAAAPAELQKFIDAHPVK